MWVADMDFKTADPIINALKERVEQGIYGYTALSDGYYQSFIKWVKKWHDWDVSKESLIFSPGVVPTLIFAIQALTEPQEKVIIQSPVYGPFRFSVEQHDRVLVNNPLVLEDGVYRMDFVDLQKKIDTGAKTMILCNPHNPIGKVWLKDDLEKLADMIVKNDMVLISDEIHSDLIMKGHKHIPISSLNDSIKNRTITCMSPSKTFNLAGLQSSIIVIPNKDLRDKVYHKFDIMDLRINNCFGQIAFEAAYSHGEEWLEQALVYIEDNAKFVNDYIKDHIPELKTYIPEATYLMWFDCRKLGMSHKMLEKFMNDHAKVGFTSGNFFGEEGEGFMRFNLATTRSQVEEALHRIENAIRHLRM
jgi:cystathionine beta-lyase